MHGAAADWFAEHGDPIAAIRHAQAAEDWVLASRLLWDAGIDLFMDGRAAAVHDLLEGFPRSVIAADAELIALSATDELYHGSLEEAERQLALATQAPEPAERRAYFEVRLVILRLCWRAAAATSRPPSRRRSGCSRVRRRWTQCRWGFTRTCTRWR